MAAYGGGRLLAGSVFVRLAGLSGASAVGLGAYGTHGNEVPNYQNIHDLPTLRKDC